MLSNTFVRSAATPSAQPQERTVNVLLTGPPGAGKSWFLGRLNTGEYGNPLSTYEEKVRCVVGSVDCWVRLVIREVSFPYGYAQADEVRPHLEWADAVAIMYDGTSLSSAVLGKSYLRAVRDHFSGPVYTMCNKADVQSRVHLLRIWATEYFQTSSKTCFNYDKLLKCCLRDVVGSDGKYYYY